MARPTLGGGNDILEASDNRSETAPYRWDVGQPGLTGKVYAKTGHRAGCRNDCSPVVPAN